VSIEHSPEGTGASLYTQWDTPMFTCAKAPIDAILAQLVNMD